METRDNAFNYFVLEITWMEVIRQDIEAKGLSEGILLDRNVWRKLIHVPDPA